MKLDLDYIRKICRSSLKETMDRCTNRVSLKNLGDDDDKPIKEVIYVSYY